MFIELEKINARPKPFEHYTAEELWTNEHTAKKMLEYHLNEKVDAASRNRDFIERSVSWIAEEFDIGQVADFGCGPGLYGNRLAALGAEVTGIDFSGSSLEHARRTAAREGLEVNYVQANYLDFETEKRFDLIIMIMCDFCALRPAQRARLLGKFRALLKSGGSLLFDVYTMNFFDQKEETASYEKNQLMGFWSAEDYYGFVNSFKYDEEKVLLDKYTIIERNRTREVYNWLQCYSEESLRAELQENGFEISALYSSVAGDDPGPDTLEMAIRAR
jgi:2-polyprenyl-3-methyl-5-hydroxy-6-metoxy-1,4-benzoquinol methylase